MFHFTHPHATSEGEDVCLLDSIEFSLVLYPRPAAVVSLPPHLYGELVKTSAGCDMLRASGHVDDYAQYIRSESKEGSQHCCKVQVTQNRKSRRV